MFRFDTPPRLHLSCGQQIAWQQRRSVRLQVQAGLLWVTRENDIADHFLRPGDSLLLQGGRWATLGAEHDAVVHIEADERKISDAACLSASR